MTISLKQTLQTTAISTVLFAGAPIDSLLSDIPQYDQASTSIDQLKDFDPYSMISTPLFNTEEKIQIIGHFASNLLADMEESPIEFAQALDQHFWDLI